MNKMVINHLEKLFVTNDAATVIKELEVQIYYIQLISLNWNPVNLEFQEVNNYRTFISSGRKVLPKGFVIVYFLKF